MRYQIEQIFKLDYAQYQGKNTNEAPGLKSVFDNLKNDITPLTIKENLLTESSIGHGSISKVPWVRVYDEVAAPSAKNGVYIVYLFSKNGDSVYLTLNQGVENSNKEFIDITTKKYSKVLIVEILFYIKNKLRNWASTKIQLFFLRNTINSLYHQKKRCRKI